MKPVISKTDYNKLLKIVQNATSSPSAREAMLLAKELNLAQIVPDEKLSPDVVRLNSTIKITDDSGKDLQIQIVAPADADIKHKKVSVLAPLSIALLGFKENDTVIWELPAGKKTLFIKKVIQIETTSKKVS